MKSIYASKLYKASKRKDRINAALIAPTNLALVQQLAESLDEEYKTLENFGMSPKEEKKDSKEDTGADIEDFVVDEEIDPQNDLVTMDDLGEASSSKGNKSSKPSKAPKHRSELDEKSEPKEDQPKADTSELIPESPANDQNSEPEASTNVTEKEEVNAATVLDLTTLKATLNSRGDTAGVTRIAEKENEVWIYYKDDVNLNNIMVDVIDYLMNSGYESFEFNRLARSDNAIVFEVKKETKDIIPQKKVEASTSAQSE